MAAVVLRYIRAAGPCLRKRPITRICKAANRTASRDGLVLTAVCRLKRTGSTTAWLLPVFICSFLVSLLGLILSIVGLDQIKKQGGKGKGLAIAGIIISAAGMVIQVILVIALIAGGASYAIKAIDEAKTDSSYSQSSSGNGDSSDKSKAQDNLDDALDDTLGETHDDLADGDYGLYDSIQDFVDSSEFKDSIESKADTFADTGITFNYRVDGDTLVYEYVLDDSYASLGDTVASSLDAMDSTYQSTANLLGSMCKTSSGKASLRVIMHTQSGQSLYDKTWTEK